MPNFHTKTLNNPSLPFREDGYNFNWSVKNDNSEMVMIEKNSEKFFLSIYNKNSNFLVKSEKISRPTQVIYLQEALGIYAKRSNSSPLFSNIKPASNRYKKNSPILKNIDFFAKNIFSKKNEVCLEIGFGSGRHLLYQAQQNPDKIFIGVEIHKPSIEQVIKQCDILDIKNIIVIDYDARTLLEFLPSNLLSKIFIHFPVPWDKKPHRRVMSRSFVDEAIRVLKKNGTIELRTDSDFYYEYSVSVFKEFDESSIKIIKNKDIDISSKYEDRWKRMDKDIYDVVFTNKISSEDVGVLSMLCFDNALNFDRIKSGFKPKTQIEKDFFIHFETLHSSDENLALKLAFGDTQRAEHSFIVVSKDGSGYYFPKTIYATKTNIKAHNLVKKWLNG